jgi:hypothetical protein
MNIRVMVASANQKKNVKRRAMTISANHDNKKKRPMAASLGFKHGIKIGVLNQLLYFWLSGPLRNRDWVWLTIPHIREPAAGSPAGSQTLP